MKLLPRILQMVKAQIKTELLLLRRRLKMLLSKVKSRLACLKHRSKPWQLPRNNRKARRVVDARKQDNRFTVSKMASTWIIQPL